MLLAFLLPRLASCLCSPAFASQLLVQGSIYSFTPLSRGVAGSLFPGFLSEVDMRFLANGTKFL